MEYALPQFLHVKSKIAGPFDFKQLLFVIGGFLISIIFYFILPTVIHFLLAAIPITAISLILAFGKIKGFPIPTMITRSFSFIFAGKKYLWKKTEGLSPTIPQIKKKEEAEVDKTAALKISSKSRLREISKLIEVHSK